ncbi:MAG: hypothetical protein ACKO3R_05750 [bacterium]
MILVCSAWEKETKYLDLCQDKFKIIHLGIGYLQAALNLQKFILKSKEGSVLIEKIYFLGTAGLVAMPDGTIPQQISSMPVFSVNKVSLTLPLSLKKQAYVPKAYPEFSLQLLNNLNIADCLSSLEITSSSEFSREIGDLLVSRENAEIGVRQQCRTHILENMELYGIAQVAQEFNISCSAILGVTNKTDANAHKDWSKNHKRVSKLLCRLFSLGNPRI